MYIFLKAAQIWQKNCSFSSDIIPMVRVLFLSMGKFPYILLHVSSFVFPFQ